MDNKEIIEKLNAVLVPAVNEEGLITLSRAKELLDEADFNWKEATLVDVLEDVFEALDGFEIIQVDSEDYVKCLSLPKKVEDEQVTPLVLNIPTLNRRIGGIIKKLLTDSPNAEGLVPLTKLGDEMKKQGLLIPDGEKLKPFLAKSPSLFELITNEGGTFVRNIKKDAPAVQEPLILPANNAKVATGTRYVSMYNIFDFACFDDYAAVKRQLSEMAAPEGWFVLESPSERDPYILIDYHLRINFAIAVRQQMEYQDGTFLMTPAQASFTTGFFTADNNSIIARFELNQQRDAVHWQTWKFKDFCVEGEE